MSNRILQKDKRNTKTELRTYAAVRPIIVRTTADGRKQIAGTSIRYRSQSLDLGGFVEIVAGPETLARTLREQPDILALRDHDQTLLLGRTTAGTLELTNTSDGLDFVITLPKSAIGDDTAENVSLRNLTGVSFGFTTREDSWSQDEQGNVTRTLLDIDLLEISVTSFPAYPATSVVSLRSAPLSIRKKLDVRSDDDSDTDTDDSDPCNPDSPDYDPDADECLDDEDCRCDCRACTDDRCEECSAEDCEGNCEDCPMEAEAETEDLRSRLKAAEERIAAEPELETLRLRLKLAELGAKAL